MVWKNFTINNIDLNKHEIITENALEWLEQNKTLRKYDLIFLDPPTFSNSKKMVEEFEVERDQNFLVNCCMEMLSPEGVLYFSNNKRKFNFDKYKEKNQIDLR
jgi:23S rRNA (cytosine1962-C5)-methyltransferase/23S rRNA (guanine2445-N2)-methyltransferase / 23S rRNA (guanine2069-N7)-methyltransferase